VKATALWMLAGFFSAGNKDRTCDSGVTLTPSVGAESMTTPAEPRPRARRSWIMMPPNEWPMMNGGVSSASMTLAR
jgi:hypothetical protein